MKKLLLVLMLIPIYSFSQGLTKETSKRVYFFRGFGESGYTYMYYDKDTSVNHHQLSRFLIYRYMSSKGGYIYNFYTNIYLFDSAGVVVYFDLLNDQIKDTIINYNLSINDSIIINHPKINIYYHKAKVIDKFTDTKNGIPISAQKYSFSASINSSINVLDTLYDKIGYVKNFILPWDYFDRAGDGGFGGELQCYYDKEYGLIPFGNNDKISCEQIILVGNTFLEKKPIQVYPNPFNEFIEIFLEQKSVIKIFSLSGNLVYNKTHYSGNSIINLNDLGSGMYILQANDQYFKKLIKN